MKQRFTTGSCFLLRGTPRFGFKQGDLMAIPDRVAAALRAYVDNNIEQALHDICSAISATCIKMYGNDGRSKYKQFIAENMQLITRLATGSFSAGELRYEFNHPRIKPGSDGLIGLEDTIYHLVRCGLYHEASISDGVIFTDEGSFLTGFDSGIGIDKSFVLGIIMAVVLSPVNATESSSTLNFTYPLGSDKILISDLWGRKSEVERYLNLQ